MLQLKTAHAATKIAHAATKTQYSQINKFFLKAMDGLNNIVQVTENMISELKDRLTEFTISEKQVNIG